MDNPLNNNDDGEGREYELSDAAREAIARIEADEERRRALTPQRAEPKAQASQSAPDLLPLGVLSWFVAGALCFGEYFPEIDVDVRVNEARSDSLNGLKNTLAQMPGHFCTSAEQAEIDEVYVYVKSRQNDLIYWFDDELIKRSMSPIDLESYPLNDVSALSIISGLGSNYSFCPKERSYTSSADDYPMVAVLTYADEDSAIPSSLAFNSTFFQNANFCDQVYYVTYGAIQAHFKTGSLSVEGIDDLIYLFSGTARAYCLEDRSPLPEPSDMVLDPMISEDLTTSPIPEVESCNPDEQQRTQSAQAFIDFHQDRLGDFIQAHIDDLDGIALHDPMAADFDVPAIVNDAANADLSCVPTSELGFFGAAIVTPFESDSVSAIAFPPSYFNEYADRCDLVDALLHASAHSQKMAFHHPSDSNDLFHEIGIVARYYCYENMPLEELHLSR